VDTGAFSYLVNYEEGGEEETSPDGRDYKYRRLKKDESYMKKSSSSGQEKTLA